MPADFVRRSVDLDWVDLSARRRADPFGGAFQAEVYGAGWRGVRVLRGKAGPGEIREGYLLGHLVGVHLSDPAAVELRWAGGSWRTSRLAPGSVQLLPARVAWAARWREPAEVILLELAPELVSAAAAADGARGPPDLRPAAGLDDRFVASAALALAEEARAGAPGGPLCGESLAAAVAAHLVRTRAEPGIPAPMAGAALPRPRLDRVLEYVDARLDATLSLHDLAGVAGMDVYRFARAFKGRTGLSPHRYVLQARVERAKALLRDGALSISEIALRTGFATPSHFATTFRRLTRATPRAYRDALM